MLKYAAYNGSTWEIQVIDNSGNNGAYNSLVLDESGQPQIAYHGCTGEDLKYARYVGSGGNCGPLNSWSCEIVDSVGLVGEHTAMALDAAGRPHISYWDQTNMSLKYARFDGVQWIFEVPAGPGTVSGQTSLVLDAAGRPHISYMGDMRLKYAWFDGVAWQHETADPTSAVGYHTSLALDDAGTPHIAYYSSARRELKYARRDALWQVEVVDMTGQVGAFASLALDGADRPHIAYQGINNRDLKYAYYDGGAWQLEVVDSAGELGFGISLALDSAGRPHIAYNDYTTQALLYAVFDGTAWQTETVPGATFVWLYLSLALDAADRPHITYYDSSGADLEYVFFDGAAWQSATVDDAGDVGMYNSLALDRFGRPHVAYQDLTNAALKYAAYDGAGWQIEEVDGSERVGFYASLELDAADRPHIAYYDQWQGDLRYARRDGGAWQITVVDELLDTGQHASLELDAFGYPHIAYFDAFYGFLRYAQYDGATWHTETVDSPRTVGQYASLALDRFGRPHIAYFDATWYDLKYAYLPCVPLTGLTVAGPAVLLPGETAVYTATALPPTASPTVTVTWDDGAVGATAAYSWTDPGTYFLTVTATNGCSSVRTTRQVCVSALLGALRVSGPAELRTGETGLFTATLDPPTGTQPITITWDNGAVGATAAYSWTEPGAYTLAVTATNGCRSARATQQVHVCAPLGALRVSGSAELRTGETGLFTATLDPPTATEPITITWDNGAMGATAAYSWTEPGGYTITVTATNACSSVRAAWPVAVCRPVLGLAVQGPAALFVGEEAMYQAVYTPTDTTWPLTVTWSNGTVGLTAAYSWTTAGAYTVTATAVSHCGMVTGHQGVWVEARRYWIYLPVVRRNE